MQHATPALSIRWPFDTVGSGQAHARQAHARQAGRQIIIYDPALGPRMPRTPRRRARNWPRLSEFGALLWDTRPVWLGTMALGAAVGAAITLATPREYAATGVLVGLDSEGAAAQDELSIIRSDSVERDIVERVGAARILDGLYDPAPWSVLFPTCPPEATATDCALAMVQPRLAAEVDATPSGTARVLRLAAHHPDPAVAVAMVDAAVAADRSVWRNVHTTDRAGALEPQLAEAERAISDTLAAESRVRATAGITNIAQDMAVSAAEAGALARRSDQIRERQSAVEAELATTRQALLAAPATVFDSREVRTGDTAQTAQAALLQLKLERAHMAQLYAPDYPGLAELDRKIATVEDTLRVQARSSKSVTRDVRNPLLAGLSARAAALDAEDAALVRQGGELQRQSGPIVARQAVLRNAEAQLATLEQRRATQETVVRELALDVANLRAQDTVAAARLDERRLLQRPSASRLPRSAGALVGGALSGLACGMAAAVLLGHRRRLQFAPQERSSRAHEKLLEPAATSARLQPPPQPAGALQQDNVPQVAGPATLPRIDAMIPAGARPDDAVARALLTDELATVHGIRMFASRPDGARPVQGAGRTFVPQSRGAAPQPRAAKQFAYVDRESHFVMIGASCARAGMAGSVYNRGLDV